jgi:hypothetical protein
MLFPLLIYRSFGANTDAAGCNHQLSMLVSVLDNAFSEDEFPGSLTFFLPGLAGLVGSREYIAWADMAVILKVLLGVQTASAATTTAGFELDTGRLLAGPEPIFADLGTQEVVRVKLGAGLGKGWWRDNFA